MRCGNCGGHPPTGQQCTRCMRPSYRKPRSSKYATFDSDGVTTGGGCVVVGVTLLVAIASLLASSVDVLT